LRFKGEYTSAMTDEEWREDLGEVFEWGRKF